MIGSEYVKHKSLDGQSVKERTMIFYKNSKETVAHHLWLELLAMIILGLVSAGMVYFLVSYAINKTDMGTNAYISYQENRDTVQSQLIDIVEEINNLQLEERLINVDSEFLGYQIANWDTFELAEYLDIYDIRKNNSVEKQEEEVKTLFNKLNKLKQDNDWNKTSVNRMVIDYYTSLGITEQILIETQIKRILQDKIDSGIATIHSETYIVNSTGEVMYEEDLIDKINLISAIQKTDKYNSASGNSEFVAIYPVIINNEVNYLYNESELAPTYHTVHTDLGNIMGFIVGAIVFIIIVFTSTREKVIYIEYLSKCLGEISKGDLSYKIDIIGQDELAEVAKSIMHMEESLKYHIDAQMQAEKSKNELVTNVAHDLRTPLTSIIGYIGLIKDDRYEIEEEKVKYLDIAYTKAEKLKILIEDLFELTKLHNRGTNLKKEKISLSNLMQQLIEELMPIANNKEIEIITSIETTNTMYDVDIQKMTRVFENLIGNAIKYSPRSTSINVGFSSYNETMKITVTNIATNISKEEVKYFFERFYRADKSRNSNDGGSGLGLAIAKNIVELHGGEINATLDKGIISFEITLPK